MKNLFLILTMMVAVVAAPAQISWPSGKATVETDVQVASDSTVDITTFNNMTYVDVDTLENATVTLNVTSTTARPGAVLVYELTCDGTGRTVAFGTNLAAPNKSLTASKTYTATFLYTGSTYILIGYQQTD